MKFTPDKTAGGEQGIFTDLRNTADAFASL